MNRLSEIQIGITTEEEVIAMWGDPIEETEKFGMRALIYRAEKIFQCVICIGENGTVSLASFPAQIDEEYIPVEYKEPITFFSRYAHGAQTIAFPRQGRTYIVTSTGKIISTIYHICMSKEAYLKTIGCHFPTENPFLDKWLKNFKK